MGIKTLAALLFILGIASASTYFELYDDEAENVTVTFTSADNYTSITNMSLDLYNGFIPNAGEYMTANTSGLHIILLDVTFTGTLNNVYGAALCINGTKVASIYSRVKSAGNPNTNHIGASGIINVSSGNRYSLCVANEADTNDMVVITASLTAFDIEDETEENNLFPIMLFSGIGLVYLGTRGKA